MRRWLPKKSQRLVDLHLQHVGDGLAAVARRRASRRCSAGRGRSRTSPRRRRGSASRRCTWPLPSQASQRPAATLNEKRPGSKPFMPALRQLARTARGSASNSRCRSPGCSTASCRSGSGRRRPASTASQPSASTSPGAAARGTSASITSDDLPEPDTPVTAVSTPSGSSTSRPRRLWRRRAAAARSRRCGSRRRAGHVDRAARRAGSGRSGRRCCATCAGVPLATTWPPC